MSQTITQLNNSAAKVERKPSLQMRAVLHVLKADSDLYDRVSPFINLERETFIGMTSFGSALAPAIAGRLPGVMGSGLMSPSHGQTASTRP